MVRHLKAFRQEILSTDDEEASWHAVSLPASFQYVEVRDGYGTLLHNWQRTAASRTDDQSTNRILVQKSADMTRYPFEVRGLLVDDIPQHECPTCQFLH